MYTMIDPSLATPDASRGEYGRGRAKRDTTRMYVRLAQQRANRGEPLDGLLVPARAEGGLRRLLRRLWSRLLPA